MSKGKKPGHRLGPRFRPASMRFPWAPRAAILAAVRMDPYGAILMRRFEETENSPTLVELAKELGTDPTNLHNIITNAWKRVGARLQIWKNMNMSVESGAQVLPYQVTGKPQPGYSDISVPRGAKVLARLQAAGGGR